jgi:hypothetical protein
MESWAIGISSLSPRARVGCASHRLLGEMSWPIGHMSLLSTHFPWNMTDSPGGPEIDRSFIPRLFIPLVLNINFISPHQPHRQSRQFSNFVFRPTICKTAKAVLGWCASHLYLVGTQLIVLILGRWSSLPKKKAVRVILMVSGSLGQHLFCPRVVAAAAAAAAAAEAGPAGLAGPVVAVTSISISISISTPMLCRSDKSVAD